MKHNSVQLIGYVGTDPVISLAENGTKRAMIRVATHSPYLDGNRKKWITTWHKVVAWASHADYAERSFLKGSHILVSGALSYQTVKDASGQQVPIAQINAHSLINLDR
jgi:single-strand DNA-binding protein